MLFTCDAMRWRRSDNLIVLEKKSSQSLCKHCFIKHNAHVRNACVTALVATQWR